MASMLLRSAALCLAVAKAGAYKNVTIGNEGLSATVFLPPSSPDELAYYNGTRFDWSTQIGDILVGPHVLFGHDYWRGLPHDPANPEAAVGLAEEFGCGDSGAVCAAGTLNHEAGAQNGVLGFEDAGPGEAFLKIGVGKLIKPSAEGYDMFGKYAFAEYPRWEVEVEEKRVVMSQEASLGRHWCYRRRTTVSLRSAELFLSSALENCGDRAFSTPHYSHNFLTVDRSPIGPPWKVVLVPNVSSKMEPGAGAWSSPIDDYFQVGPANTLESKMEVPEGIKIKADFIGDSNTHAPNEWVASYGGLEVKHSQLPHDARLYAFNFYVEQRTISPEPVQMLAVEPGQKIYWGRTLSFTLAGLVPPGVHEELVV